VRYRAADRRCSACQQGSLLLLFPGLPSLSRAGNPFLLRPQLHRALVTPRRSPPMTYAREIIDPRPAPATLRKPLSASRVAGILILGIWGLLAVAMIWLIISGWDNAKFERYGPRYLSGLWT